MSKQYNPEVKINQPELNTPQEASNLLGSFETVTAVPTAIPKNIYNQIKFYSNGTTYRIYIYDQKNGVWRYASLT